MCTVLKELIKYISSSFEEGLPFTVCKEIAVYFSDTILLAVLLG